MREFRIGGGFKECYFSLEDAAKAWGCKPYKKKKRTNDEEKLSKQRERFCLSHRCPACGEPMGYISNRWMTCVNDKCKGIKIEKTDREGNKTIIYTVSYKYLDNDKTAEIAYNLFSED